MKKGMYLIACILCGCLIIGLLAAMIVPPIVRKQAQERIIGVWFYDAFGGNGGQYVTFTQSGTVQLYEEVTAADGSTVYQDSASFGTMTYEILKGGQIRFTTSVLGSTTTETVDYRFQGRDTLVLEDTVYTRYSE